MDIRQLQLLMDSVWKIVEKQQVEKKLLAQEEQFSNLFSNMQEGVALHELIVDDQGETADYRIININHSYEKIIGLKKEEVLGKLSTEVYQTAEPPYLHQYKQVVLSGIPDQFEVYFEPLEKNFGISIVPWGKHGFATIFSDITPRKLYEQERDSFIQQLEDKNAELERFTYTVSHDLKSPLITIKGFLGMLAEDIQEGDLDQAYADMQRIHSAADKMKSLLDNLLDLSRVGRVSNDFGPINTNTLISETIEILSPMITEKKVKLIIPPELPSLYGDRARLAEVFQNLIENSLKYLGEPAEPTIQINAVKKTNDVLVSIKDNGIGIEPQYQQKIFGLFEKLDSRSPGTGVGLALVKRIIEHHGGSIWVHSAGNNQGSEFCFRLPLETKTGRTGD
jgi:PAS domain S-box-containing protein